MCQDMCHNQIRYKEAKLVDISARGLWTAMFRTVAPSSQCYGNSGTRAGTEESLQQPHHTCKIERVIKREVPLTRTVVLHKCFISECKRSALFQQRVQEECSVPPASARGLLCSTSECKVSALFHRMCLSASSKGVLCSTGL